MAKLQAKARRFVLGVLTEALQQRPRHRIDEALQLLDLFFRWEDLDLGLAWWRGRRRLLLVCHCSAPRYCDRAQRSARTRSCGAPPNFAAWVAMWVRAPRASGAR